MTETSALHATIERILPLDEYYANALASWGHPGLAIALVKEDEVIFSQGYGSRRAGFPEKVDIHTVFGIGSATKAFTAAAAGILVDHGRLQWDTPVRQYLPGFRLADPIAAAQVTLRDLLCHRTGQRRGVRMRLRSRCDVDTYIERMGRAPLLYPLRSEFHYTNTTFNVAGKLIEAASGQSWGDFLRQNIFDPLGMHNTSAESAGAAALANRAEPHAHIDGQTRTIDWLDIGQDAAGSINASIMDMAQWLRLMTNQGRFGERTILSPETWRQITSMQMAIPYPEHTDLVILQMLGADMQFWGYGLGWFVQDYRGHKFVWHAGQINGFSAMVGFLPTERFGFALATNVHETLLHGALMFATLDAYLGIQERDWSADCQSAWVAFLAQEAGKDQAIEAARVTGTHTTLPLAAYAGDYRSEWWGEMRLVLEDEQLVVFYGGARRGALEHWHYDTFRLRWDDLLEAPDVVVFCLNSQANIAGFELEGYTTFERI